jgi:hypothetical protein
VNLAEPPAPLTSRERAIYWIVLLICAVSRLLAIARTLWDWDEALFCLGMRSYDVASHHPHPPGFPVYIAAARILRVFVSSDFRALQAINLIAAVLIFPAMFMLARELRLKFSTSVIAAALLAFFPNVWFFGGTGFSDVASITLVIYAVAFLFRGCRDANAYFIGAFLLALSLGIRPQNLLVGIFPAAVATWYRTRESVRDVAFAALIGTAVVAVSYASAIHATGSFEQYMGAVRAHGVYISTIDSFRSPARPPLWRLFDRFFVKQYQSPTLSMATSFFVLVCAIGAIRERDRRMLFNLLTFGPFAVSAWLMLDRFSINRFSIGYAPMFAIFAAEGIRRLSRRTDVEAALGAAVIAGFVIWTYPVFDTVRNTVAPSVQAIEAVRQHIDYNREDLFVAFSMTPFVEYFLPNAPYKRVLDERALPLSSATRTPFLLTELDHTSGGGYVFRRERGRLWNITRRHYFDVALEPVRKLPQFVSGWMPPEHSGTDEWRWMQAKSVTLLPPASGSQLLRLKFDVPDELMPQHPTIAIRVNGATIDQFQPSEAHLDRDYPVMPGPGVNTLEITTDRTLKSSDPRQLGLLVRFLSWGPE